VRDLPAPKALAGRRTPRSKNNECGAEKCIGEADRKKNKFMKRVGNLFDRIVEPENLRLAFWKASRSKRNRLNQRSFVANLEQEVKCMRLGLIAGDYEVGNYTMFKIWKVGHFVALSKLKPFSRWSSVRPR
jgi:hypothetical protein